MKDSQKRKYKLGIELEFLSQKSTSEVYDELPRSLRAKCIVKNDSSIDVEYYDDYCSKCDWDFKMCSKCEAKLAKLYGSDIEIAMLTNELTYKKDLKLLLDKVKPFSKVNRSCGLHVHLDLGHRNPDVTYTNLYNNQDLIFAMCNKTRRNNSYCMRNTSKTIYGQSLVDGRTAINVKSIPKHNTIEVRAHHGSLDYDEITTYIDTLIHIAGHNKNNSYDISKMDDKLRESVIKTIKKNK